MINVQICISTYWKMNRLECKLCMQKVMFNLALHTKSLSGVLGAQHKLITA